MLEITRRTRFWLLGLAFLAIGIGTGAAQPRAGITIYDDVNFRGEGLNFRDDVKDLRQYRFNDRISSVQVAPGEFWELCENDNFGGRCIVVSGFERDLRARDFNDAVSSMRRVRGRDDRRRDRDDDRDFDRDRDRGGAQIVPPAGRGEMVLFDRPGYRGTMLSVKDLAPGLGGFTSRAQSVQILDGVWELCEGARWTGRCVRVTGSVPDLSRIGLSGVGSARSLPR